MKKLLLILGLFPLLAISCNKFTNTNSSELSSIPVVNPATTQVDYFNKKLECAKLEPAIKHKLLELRRTHYSKDANNYKENNVLVKLFYSDTYNACLYAYVTEDAVDFSMYSKLPPSEPDPERVPLTHDLFKIANALTHELIFVEAKGNIYYPDFEKKINELEVQ